MYSKTKMLTDTLTEQLLAAAAWKETEIEIQDDSDQFSSIGYFGLSSFRSKVPKASFVNSATFTE